MANARPLRTWFCHTSVYRFIRVKTFAVTQQIHHTFACVSCYCATFRLHFIHAHRGQALAAISGKVPSVSGVWNHLHLWWLIWLLPMIALTQGSKRDSIPPLKFLGNSTKSLFWGVSLQQLLLKVSFLFFFWKLCPHMYIPVYLSAPWDCMMLLLFIYVFLFLFFFFNL